MIPRDDFGMPFDAFDWAVPQALRASLCSEEPSPRVREAVLRAATEDRRRAVEASFSQYLATDLHDAQSEMRSVWDGVQFFGSDAPTIGMLQAHLLRSRFVV